MSLSWVAIENAFHFLYPRREILLYLGPIQIKNLFGFPQPGKFLK